MGALLLGGAALLLCCAQRAQIRQLTKERERYYRASRQDCLTGLLNKSAFVREVEDFLTAEQTAAYPAALLLLDLDDFKAVNDTCGHAAGDRALLLTAHLLQQVFPACLLGRAGGDEFVVWVPGEADHATLYRRALELRRTLAERSAQDGMQLSCSAGIALCPRDGATFSTLFAAADAAMYQAKREKKRVCTQTLSPSLKRQIRSPLCRRTK